MSLVPEPGRADPCLHTRETFEFVVQAPLAEAFPLFGADKERAWADDWNPRFVWPARPEDREGMVFQIAHGERSATWVNTVFEPQAGRVQYVYVLPDVMATTIRLTLSPLGDETRVTVCYERTALTPRANAQVAAMAGQDRAAGPEWAAQINAYLSRATDRPTVR